MSERLELLRATAGRRREECRRIKLMIVERLNLEIPPDWITDDQPILGRGLELDSVDTLELMVGVGAEFGVVITDDELGVFGSISSLVERIESESGEEPVPASA